MGEPAPFTVPNASRPGDRGHSVRAHAWAGLVASGLCAVFAARVFFIMFAPTHSFATAVDLCKHDKGVRTAVTALVVLSLGSILTFNRLTRAASWAQLSRTDRALSILGIIPAGLVYYPIVAAATGIGLALNFLILAYVNLVRRIDRHMPWGRRD